MSSIQQIAEETRSYFEPMYAAREQGLKLSREAIRLSANGIRAIHRLEEQEALTLIGQAGKAIDSAANALRDYPQVYYAGFLQDAQKEYAEGRITFAIIFDREIPVPSDLGMGIAPFLNGLGEAAGEVRRHVLDTIRTKDPRSCERLLRLMEDIYFLLVSVDYPDSVTGGLRRTTDMVRGVLEKTRGDLTFAIRQAELQQALENAHRQL